MTSDNLASQNMQQPQSLALPTPRAPQFTYPPSGPSSQRAREGQGLVHGQGQGQNGEEADKPSRPPQRVTVGVPEITAVQGLVPTLQ